MSLAQKVKLWPDERLDKIDFDNVSSFIGADFNNFFKNIVVDTSHIVTGFRIYSLPTGGTDSPVNSPVYVELVDSVILHSSATSGSKFYVGSNSLDRAQVSLVSNNTNYIELDLTTETAGEDTRVFWSKDNEEEYTQTVDTVTNLIASVTVNTTGWTGGTVVPLAEIDVNVGGTITAIKDRRNLFFRLGTGQPYDATAEWSYASRVEPDEDRKNDANAFIGGDKEINTLKEAFDAIMTKLKEIKGGKYWYEDNTDTIESLSEDKNLFLATMDVPGGPPNVVWTLGPDTLAWAADMYLVHPYRGTYIVGASPGGLTLLDGDIVFIMINRPHRAVLDGTNGHFWIEPAVSLPFTNGDRVYIGDFDTVGLNSTINAPPVPGTGDIPVVDNCAPYTVAAGAYIMNREAAMLNVPQNTSVLIPTIAHLLDKDIFVVGQRIGANVYFRNGLMY